MRLPDGLVVEIEAESEQRGVSKSDIVRERLTQSRPESSRFSAIIDLIGSVEGLPKDLSTAKKTYLRTTGYGRKRSH